LAFLVPSFPISFLLVGYIFAQLTYKFAANTKDAKLFRIKKPVTLAPLPSLAKKSAYILCANWKILWMAYQGKYFLKRKIKDIVKTNTRLGLEKLEGAREQQNLYKFCSASVQGEICSSTSSMGVQMD
jgi:hypothetical protein